MKLFSPYSTEWNFGRIPEIESAPPDSVLVVMVPDVWAGLMYPWGDKDNPTRWVGYGRPNVNCIDGKWSIYDQKRCEFVWEDRNVWWAWAQEGTKGMIHDYPTWRQVNGRF